MALKNALPDGNVALKITYQTGIWLSKSLTGRESGHQMFLPDMIYLTGKIYDLIMHGLGWSGGEPRIDYVRGCTKITSSPVGGWGKYTKR